MASSITKVHARQIFDSRGNPTLECEVWCGDKKFVAAVPSGASTGVHEACELRDGGDAYMGKGVTKAVANIINVLGPAVTGMDAKDQSAVDAKMTELDGTENKTSLGGNAILGVSLAVCRAGADAKGVPLFQHIADLAGNKKITIPVPSLNIINGGVHAGNLLPMQEFMIVPEGAATMAEAMRMGTEVYHTLKGLIKAQYGIDACNVGDEGGFAPNVGNLEEALALVDAAIKKAGYEGRIKIGMDPAASEFYDEGKKVYDLDFKGATPGVSVVSGAELLALYKEKKAKYPIVFIEDPFAEDDWDSFRTITGEDLFPIIGDDLLCTNPKRVQKAIDTKAASGLLLKVNQIGTVTESIKAVAMAKAAGWTIMTSHRSGETCDDFIADLSVGLSTGLIKTGAPCRGERLAKYIQLMRIEEQLGEKAVYAGANWKYQPWQ